jgi:hypothetical protein
MMIVARDTYAFRAMSMFFSSFFVSFSFGLLMITYIFDYVYGTERH